MSLEALRAKFVAAHEEFCGFVLKNYNKDLGEQSDEETADFYARVTVSPYIKRSSLNSLFGDLCKAASRYTIARDFNQYDPDKADMLWKLQNGGAQ